MKSFLFFALMTLCSVSAASAGNFVSGIMCTTQEMAIAFQDYAKNTKGDLSQNFFDFNTKIHREGPCVLVIDGEITKQETVIIDNHNVLKFQFNTIGYCMAGESCKSKTFYTSD